MLAATAVFSWLPALIDQARDVDVLLYAAAAARSNAAGTLPYIAAWIEKGPLAMGLFQILFALFGAFNLAALALAWLVLALGTMWMVACLARRLGGGAWWAAAFFAAALPAVGGSLNTEVPAAAAAMGALLIWLRARQQRGGGFRLAVVAGLLAGTAFLCRQNAGILAPALVAADLISTGGVHLPWRLRLGRPLALLVGFVALPLLTVLVYAALGELESFLFCFHGYNVNFYMAATRVTTERLLLAPWTAVTNFLVPVATVATLGLAGMVAVLWGPLRFRRADPGQGVARLAVLLLALSLFASLFAGLRFFAHYFALALPFWAALGGWFTGTKIRHARPLHALAVTLLVMTALGLEVGRRPWLDTLRRTREWVVSGRILDAADPLAWPRRDGLATAAARYIRANSSPDDRVFVWGMRPHVQVYARRLPATRFVTSTFLTGVVPWERLEPADGTADWIVPGSWDLFMADMEQERPLFVVDASYDHMFANGAHSPEHYPLLRDLLARQYEQVKSFGEIDRMILWRRKSEESSGTFTSGYPETIP